MLARRFPGLLPPLTLAESILVTKIYSLVAEEPLAGLLQIRPFRSPHSGASTAAVLGGGAGGVRPPRPGEATLAHCGVLFLDDLPDFGRPTLETLRAPLETGVVTLLRPGSRVQFPARFSLIAAMSPCPCGHLGNPRMACTCSPAFIRRFRERISGLTDRLDLHVEVPAVSLNELRSGPGETTAQVVRRVAAAQAVQLDRFGPGASPAFNAAMTPQQVSAFCSLDAAGSGLLEVAFEKLGLSAASRHCILKVARTIADMAGSDSIRTSHLAEAIQNRRADTTVAK
jgi:magnesium chelatase family protein